MKLTIDSNSIGRLIVVDIVYELLEGINMIVHGCLVIFLQIHLTHGRIQDWRADHTRREVVSRLLAHFLRRPGVEEVRYQEGISDSIP